MLTEDANRRSQPLWERYLSFEFETGDLQSALRLEKRAREALGEGGSSSAGTGSSTPAGPGSSTARSMAMLLLRYEFDDTWPCDVSQRPYLAYVAGKGPAPPGYERRKGDIGDEGPRGRGSERGGPVGASPGAEPVTFGGDADPTNPYNRPLPRIVEDFLDRLPPPQYLDGPLPDIDAVVEAFYRTDLTSEGIRAALVSGEPSGVGPAPGGLGPRGSPARNGGPEGGMGGGSGLGYTPPRGADGGVLGVKRDLEGDDDEDMGRGPVRDVYRMRVKQRARIGAGGEGGG